MRWPKPDLELEIPIYGGRVLVYRKQAQMLAARAFLGLPEQGTRTVDGQTWTLENTKNGGAAYLLGWYRPRNLSVLVHEVGHITLWKKSGGKRHDLAHLVHCGCGSGARGGAHVALVLVDPDPGRAGLASDLPQPVPPKGPLMNRFNNLMNRLLQVEGEYSNDPNDPGGETYCGISRRYWPNWRGWAVVDAYNHEPISTDPVLRACVFEFYRANFYDQVWGDNLPSEELAWELFEIAVNLGSQAAIRMLQEALVLLGAEILVDGRLGPATKGTLPKPASREMEYLILLVNRLQAMHYIEEARRHPNQKRYLRGWLNRT